MAISQQVDHYEVLGLVPGASGADIHAAYRRLARQYHPDVNRAPGAATRMREINAAYDALEVELERQGIAAAAAETTVTTSEPAPPAAPGVSTRSTATADPASASSPFGTGPASTRQAASRGYRSPRRDRDEATYASRSVWSTTASASTAATVSTAASAVPGARSVSSARPDHLRVRVVQVVDAVKRHRAVSAASAVGAVSLLVGMLAFSAMSGGRPTAARTVQSAPSSIRIQSAVATVANAANQNVALNAAGARSNVGNPAGVASGAGSTSLGAVPVSAAGAPAVTVPLRPSSPTNPTSPTDPAAPVSPVAPAAPVSAVPTFAMAPAVSGTSGAATGQAVLGIQAAPADNAQNAATASAPASEASGAASTAGSSTSANVAQRSASPSVPVIPPASTTSQPHIQAVASQQVSEVPSADAARRALSGYDKSWANYLTALRFSAAGGGAASTGGARSSGNAAALLSGDGQLGLSRALYTDQWLAWNRQMSNTLAAANAPTAGRPDASIESRAGQRLKQASDLVAQSQSTGAPLALSQVSTLLNEADQLHREYIALWVKYLAEIPV